MIRSKSLYYLIRISALLCFFALASCGGGTSGTGLRMIKGRIADPAGQPLSAEITIAETGDTTNSDNAGMFQLNSEIDLTQITLLLRGNSFDTSVKVESIPDNAEQLNVEVQVDATTNSAEAVRLDFSSIENFEVAAAIVGKCAEAFKDLDQIHPIPEGSYCDIDVRVTGDSKPVGGVLVSLERQACGKAKPWRTFETGITQTQPHVGLLQLKFRFYANERACRYRVVAPFGDDRRRQSVKIIKTIAVNSDN